MLHESSVKKIFASTWLCGVMLILNSSASAQKPNILVILADDLGYGDVSCYNSESKVKTPHIDQLAKTGLRFTDAHSPSTVCTPTRYSLLTGRMAFRTGMRGVFTGVGGPCMIEPKRVTLASMLKQKGYATACIGKWHVGMTFFDKEGKPINKNGLEAVKQVDYSRRSPDSPIHRGFDHFFGTVCCPTTDWLYAYMDGDIIPKPPTRILDKTPLPKHAYSRDNRGGLIADDFDLEKVDLMFLEKSKQFLIDHAAKETRKPFFLLHSTQAVHLPSFPADQFKGKTGFGPHGDFIHELDFIVGELMDTLKKLDMVENTLVIFTSDNGPETASVVNMRKDHQHDGARPWRGVKRDNWEGGHRVPFIARWPKVIAANQETDQTFCLTDVMATCASIVGYKLNNRMAEDSFDFFPVLKDPGLKKPVREFTIHQTISLALAIRSGKWKYLDHKGSGGNRYDRGRMKKFALPEGEPDSPGQLYDLEQDPGETTNLYSRYPDVVQRLRRQLNQFKDIGASAPIR